jgi:hypothetical protein
MATEGPVHHGQRDLFAVPSLTVIDWVWELEEAFGVEIPDALFAIGTIGDLKRLITKRLRLAPASHCATQHEFYRLRGAVCSALGIPRSQVRPGTRWADLRFPWGRRIGWRAIRSHARKSLPALSGLATDRRLFAYLLLTLVVSLAGAIWIVIGGYQVRELLGILAETTVIAISGILLGGLILGPGPLPVRRKAIGDTARLLAALETPIPDPRKRLWTREEVSLTIDRLLVKATGVHDFTDSSLPID